MPDPDAELTQLAGGFIHELKNHIGTLGLHLQLLAEDFDGPQTPRERKALQRINRVQGECSRLYELSQEFLRFARIRDLKLSPHRLDAVVAEVVDFVTPTARAQGIEVVSFVPSTLPLLRLDRELFKQALLNLVLNAEQAMPDGGELTVVAATAGKGVAVAVIDTGVGIPEATLEKVFEPFYTSKPDGNGLGLPTTRRIVQAHGGEIYVESEPGHGTRFTVWLPAPPVLTSEASS